MATAARLRRRVSMVTRIAIARRSNRDPSVCASHVVTRFARNRSMLRVTEGSLCTLSRLHRGCRAPLAHDWLMSGQRGPATFGCSRRLCRRALHPNHKERQDSPTAPKSPHPTRNGYRCRIHSQDSRAELRHSTQKTIPEEGLSGQSSGMDLSFHSAYFRLLRCCKMLFRFKPGGADMP
jgi:hypothetical protein